MNLTNKQKGLGLSLIGVLLITPDSLFLRLIDLGAWELVFYRGLVPVSYTHLTLPTKA